MEANFLYELEDEDLIRFSKLSIQERLYWLEAIFELTVKTETELEKKIRNFFREDGNTKSI
ncbi:MAG: hypothetical protein H7A24_00150 [Leptospiraceae bacterium]|nr:hypothetical protein [Leptospiraceae bacterium]MCP5510262.1 hypothetical protein [Leptospiraceae bacterium]